MDMHDKAPHISQRRPADTWTRRSLVSWLGKSCALALASRGVSACSTPPTASTQRFGSKSCDDGGLVFQPGGCDTIDWGERTVDPQQLEDILANWQLTVGGLVENEFSLTFDQLVDLPSYNPVMDFHCVEGWSVLNVPWNGVHLADLLDQAVVKPTASHVNFYTLRTKYNESLPIEVAIERNTMLAYGVGGSSLSIKHGFPARVVIPKLYGYKSAKYVERIELSDNPIEGYWVKVGYSYGGEVDPSRLREGKY